MVLSGKGCREEGDTGMEQARYRDGTGEIQGWDRWRRTGRGGNKGALPKSADSVITH